MIQTGSELIHSSFSWSCKHSVLTRFIHVFLFCTAANDVTGTHEKKKWLFCSWSLRQKISHQPNKWWCDKGKCFLPPSPFSVQQVFCFDVRIQRLQLKCLNPQFLRSQINRNKNPWQNGLKTGLKMKTGFKFHCRGPGVELLRQKLESGKWNIPGSRHWHKLVVNNGP